MMQMATRPTITYEFDIAPHLRRALGFRARRIERWRRLHRHDGRAIFWRIALPACFLFWGLVGYGLYLTL
jgi:hypothetical protein